jgi:cytochrome c553
MTAYNNLALMLNESLQSMQNQMQSEMPGSGSCDKPGGKGSKPKSGDDAGDMKEMLMKQLEQMKKGNNPGGKSPGDKEGEGSQGMPGLGNKEIAKMAAQQTAIRQRLEQMRNEMNKEGKGLGNKLNPLINELEQQEKDLINKRFSKEMIKRQQDILTRLLESEKALNERGFEEKRESKSGKNFNYSNQKRIDEYNQQKLKQVELLRAVDPMYRKYYRDRASEYFNGVF